MLDEAAYVQPSVQPCPARVWSKRQTFGKSVELKSAKYSWDRIWSNTYIQITTRGGTVAVPSMFANTSEPWSESTKKLGCSWHHELSWTIMIMISWCCFSLAIPWFSFDVTASDVPFECFVTGGWPGPVSTTARHSPPTKLNQLRLSAVTTWPESQSISRDCMGLLFNLEQIHNLFLGCVDPVRCPHPTANAHTTTKTNLKIFLSISPNSTGRTCEPITNLHYIRTRAETESSLSISWMTNGLMYMGRLWQFFQPCFWRLGKLILLCRDDEFILR